jgi:hypothetical protein
MFSKRHSAILRGVFMKHLLATTAILLAAGTPAFAQTATSTSAGIASSKSAAGAVAIGGGNAAGGSAQSTINIAAQPAQTSSTSVQTINQHESGTITQRNVPAVFAPGLSAAGLETCLGSISGGGAFVGTGFSFGTSIPDPGCAARLDARTLWSMGLKKAAVARLCLNVDIYNSMPEVCVQYLPQTSAAPAGYAPAPEYSGGPVMVTMRSSGETRLCNDYNVSTQRCRVWAKGAVAAVHHPHKRVAAVTKPAVPTPPSSAVAESTEGNNK